MGDEHDSAPQWHDEELHDGGDDFELSTGQQLGQVSFRDSLRRLYRAEKFQVNHKHPTLKNNTFYYVNIQVVW